MVDVNELVADMVSSDFSDNDIIGKVQVAYYYCSAIYGENIAVASGTVGTSSITVSDNGHAMAIALLTQAILIEGRKAILTRNNPNLIIRSTSQLFTEEMRNMLIDADETPEDNMAKTVMWDNALPTEGWQL